MTFMRVLVTGASGFIGRALCSRLTAGGWQVRALLRQENSGPWEEVVCGDLTRDLPEETMKGVSTVFHLAGRAHVLRENKQDDEEYFRVNTEGTRRLLEAARKEGVSRFVFFSSVAVWKATNENCLNEASPCQPETPYGKSKLEAERLVLEGDYVPEPVVLRLTMVYGPGMKGNLPRMIDAVAKGLFPPIPEFSNKRSMVHVDDVVQAALLASEKPEAVGQTYIVTDGQAYSTREIYECLCEALGKSIPGWHIPAIVFRGLARTGDIIGNLRGRRFFFDTDALYKISGSSWYSSHKIESELGFHPNYHLRTSLPDIV